MPFKVPASFTRLAVAAFVTLWPGALSGQIIRGQVVDSSTGLPVGTGFVVLLDDAGTEIARALSTRDGQFTVAATRGGEYRVRSERIGYRAITSAPLQVSQGQTVEFVLRVAALPVRLATVRIEGRNRCRTNPEEGESTVLIWEEIRKALAATTWGEDQELFHYKIYKYQRDLPPDRSHTISETGTVRSGVSEAPFRSLPAQRLAREGYIDDRGDETWYRVPDAHVMLDPSFLGSHCFNVTRDEEQHPGQVGLSFEPLRNSRLPDVQGTLWLDEETSELRTLEVTHTRVPEGLRDRRVGGTVEFMMLPSGAWVVRRWQVRTPVIAVVEDARKLRRYTPRLDGFRDTGGEIISASSGSGTVVYEAPVASVSGVVFDSSRGVPLAGAFVSVLGTGFSTVTTRAGRYELGVPLEGEYSLSLSHPRLDSIGLPPQTKRVELAVNSTTEISFAVPPVRAVLRRLCDGTPRRESRVLVGVVRGVTSAIPVKGAKVSASWQSIVKSGNRFVIRDVREEVSTREGGFYAICDVPAGRPITVSAEKDEEISRAASLIFPPQPGGDLLMAWDRGRGEPYEYSYPAPERVWKVDLTLGVQRASSVHTAPMATLEGVVTDRGTGRALDGTTVILNNSDTTETSSDGTFNLVDVDWVNGTNRVEFRRRRYQSIAWELWVDDEESDISISVTLDPLPVELQEMEVEGARVAVPAKLVEFYERRARGRGRFLGPEELDQANAVNVLDVLRRVPGVDVVRSAGANMVGAGEYIQMSSASALCRTLMQQPLVYVDGSLFDVDFMLSLDIQHIAAIEIYNGASEMPPEFNRTGSDCGVVVLWTK